MKNILLALSMAAFASQGLAQEFTVDRASPEVTLPRSAADIYVIDGSAAALTSFQLGLPETDDIDAFSYGVDQIEPFGPRFHVSIFWSVDRLAVGSQGDACPGRGLVWREALSTDDGAAGDVFFGKFFMTFFGNDCALVSPIGPGLWATTRGLRSEAIHRLLSPTPDQSDINGLSIVAGSLDAPVFVSVDPASAQGQPWGPADILRIDPGDPPGTQPQVSIWATAAQLGLAPTADIDALAIANGGGPDFEPGDTVYVSLANDVQPVIQVSPGPQTVVFRYSALGLVPGDNLNALTGYDPGPVISEGPPPFIEDPEQEKK